MKESNITGWFTYVKEFLVSFLIETVVALSSPSRLEPPLHVLLCNSQTLKVTQGASLSWLGFTALEEARCIGCLVYCEVRVLGVLFVRR